MSNYDYLMKILLIGDSGTGKSAILNRYIDDQFDENISSTIGVDFKIKYLMHNNNSIKLQIWDTAGQERFKTITSHYYRGVIGIIIVFDLNNWESFMNLKVWLNEIDKYCNSKHSKIIIGNKADKGSVYKSDDEINDFIKKNNLQYIEVSAKEDLNIDKSFLMLINTIFDECKPEKNKVIFPNNLEKDSSSNIEFFKKNYNNNNCC